MHQLATGTITAEKRETLGDLAARDGEPPVGQLLLDALTGAVDLRLAEHLTRTPLATAARLGQFSGEVLAAAAGAVPEKVWLSLLAPLPGTHASADVDVVDLLGVEAVARIARHAAAELREAQRRADVQPSADALVDRLVSSPQAAQLALATLTDLLALPEPADETGAKRLERLLGLAAAGLRAMDGVAWAAVTEAQRTALARATARAALTGARGAVLAAIAQVDPAEITQARWWAGVDLDHLSAVTSGPLAAVLERDDVARSIVAPKAQAALRDVSTRRALLGLLASAAPVAATLSPPVVAATLGRVASSDRLLRAWLQEIQELEALHALELERDRLAHRLAEAETHLAAAREAADRHRAQAERLEARVREAERANATMREAQERQIRIDAIRALAELAAFVESSSGRVEPDRLKARVTTLVGRQGVRRVEIPDDVVAFDPRRHESVGVAVEPGEGVVVRRCGYTWDSPQEEIVLVRALVERAEHEEEH